MQEKTLSIKEHSRLLSKKVIKNLESRKFEAYYCDTSKEALEKALSLIPDGDTISWGGSVTIEEIGLLEKMRSGKFNVIDRDTAKTPEERVELMRKALLCDTFLTSFNAISEDGVLINVDGVGNRVAAITFGPKNVIAIVGMNKVCKTVEDAYSRTRNYASPVNAQRTTVNPHFKPLTKTPCILTGSCGNCKSDECICSYIVETRMSKTKGRIKIILVGESLGF